MFDIRLFLGSLGSLVSCAPPMYEKIRCREKISAETIVKEDVINQLCHPHANPSTVILDKVYIISA